MLKKKKKSQNGKLVVSVTDVINKFTGTQNNTF